MKTYTTQRELGIYFAFNSFPNSDLVAIINYCQAEGDEDRIIRDILRERGFMSGIDLIVRETLFDGSGKRYFRLIAFAGKKFVTSLLVKGNYSLQTNIDAVNSHVFRSGLPYFAAPACVDFKTN